ncbi:Microfibrillar-associated protein 1 [Mortierella alpina]|nr:Microfibrillar-associated protein 1 [Mortierella alpina]
MSSKRVGLPSLNSTSKKDALQPVKVQRYRAGKAPEGYVDPALESSDDEENETREPSARGGRAGGISMSIGSEPPKMAYQVLNVEQMTRERQLEQSQRKERGGAAVAAVGSLAAATSDRRLARLQQMQMDSQRGRGDTRSRRARADSDEEEAEEEEKSEEEDDEEEAALLRRKAARARASRVQDEEEELWGQGEEEEEEEEQPSGRRGRSRREGEESEGSSEYTSSGSEEESSEDEMAPRRKLMKPVFVPKSQRITIDESTRTEVAEELAEKARLEALEERKKESHQILKEYVARQATVEEVPDVDNLAEVDDTDGLDEEAEFEQWKLRELKRIKRDREELEAREAEKAEIERRRELTEEERVKEDMAYLAKKAKEAQAEKTHGSVEKYHHKGAFFMDSNEAILKRSTNEATPDAVKDIKALPKIMQVRNFGRAGQTKYTTLKDQDTSQPSGWTDPAVKHLQQRHRMAGFRGDDFKIASKMQAGRRDFDRGSGGQRNNANNTALGDRHKSSSADRYDRDRDSRRHDDGGRSSREYRDRDRDRDDRDRGSARGSGDRYSGRSSSSSYQDRDRDRERDRDRDRGRDRDREDDHESSKRRRH